MANLDTGNLLEVYLPQSTGHLETFFNHKDILSFIYSLQGHPSIFIIFIIKGHTLSHHYIDIEEEMQLCNAIKRTFTQSGHLLTWGETTHGWGRPTNTQYWTPGFVDNFSDVVSVSTGQYHLGFITKDNGVYTAGLDEDGRLGQASTTDNELPRRLSFDNPKAKITSLSCGTRHSLALAEDGSVYSWGYSHALGIEGSNDSGAPMKIPQEYFQNDKVIAVAAANDFSVALCDQGHFYAWGEGLIKLPLFEFESVTPRPSKMVADFLSKRHAKIKKFTAIDKFIVMLLDNGRLYSYGRNTTGVFGARLNPLVISDQELDSFAKIYDGLFKNEKIVDFQASAGSLIFKTETGKVFYNGMYSKYQPAPFPHDVQAKKIFATDSSVGVVSSDNKLYFLNDQIIQDSECLCPTSRLYESEDVNLSGEILSIGGSHSLRYALVK